jgi:hypothetical protein
MVAIAKIIYETLFGTPGCPSNWKYPANKVGQWLMYLLPTGVPEESLRISIMLLICASLEIRVHHYVQSGMMQQLHGERLSRFVYLLKYLITNNYFTNFCILRYFISAT